MQAHPQPAPDDAGGTDGTPIRTGDAGSGLLWQHELGTLDGADAGAGCGWPVPSLPRLETSACASIELRGGTSDDAAAPTSLCVALDASDCQRCGARGYLEQLTDRGSRIELCPDACSALAQRNDTRVWYVLHACTVP